MATRDGRSFYGLAHPLYASELEGPMIFFTISPEIPNRISPRNKGMGLFFRRFKGIHDPGIREKDIWLSSFVRRMKGTFEEGK
jgi:hypothetical protein